MNSLSDDEQVVSSRDLDLSLDDIIKKSNKGRGRARGKRGRNGKSYGPKRREFGGRRKDPYNYLKGLSVEEIAGGNAGGKALKVSAGSNPKKVAGAICHCIRIGGVPPALLAKGTTAINEAVKAIAIARSFLEEEEEEEEEEDGVDLIAQPSVDNETSACTIHIRRVKPMELDVEDAMPVTNNTDPYKLAGAIAGRARKKQRVSLSAIGPVSVMNAVSGISLARRYLEEDEIDIKFVPEFSSVEIDGNERSCIYFACLSRKSNF